MVYQYRPKRPVRPERSELGNQDNTWMLSVSS
jgi:hypothetical protein